MGRILAYTSPGRSHLFPLTPILDELRGRGHEIVLRTLASQVPLMRARGFDAAPIDPRIEAIEHTDWLARSPLHSVYLNAQVFCARAEHDARDLENALTACQPDVLLVDINSWGGLMAAEAHDVPWAVFCPYPLALRSRDTPPFGPGFPPARGPLGRARDLLVHGFATNTVERRLRNPLNKLRKQLGLTPVVTVDEWLRNAPLLLYMTAEPFEYPRRDWPENVVMIGPCDWDPPAEPPPWLEQVSRPIVLINTSTEFQNDGRLVQVALQALAEEPVTVVATMPTADPAGMTIPSNAHVERFIPHRPILERAACAVTHAGMGCTQKALAHGVPVCAVPFGRDQLEVARRVEIAKAGTRLPARRLNSRRLRTKITQAMACAEGAQRIAAAYAATGGPRTAVDALEARLLGQAAQASHSWAPARRKEGVSRRGDIDAHDAGTRSGAPPDLGGAPGERNSYS